MQELPASTRTSRSRRCLLQNERSWQSERCEVLFIAPIAAKGPFLRAFGLGDKVMWKLRAAKVASSGVCQADSQLQSAFRVNRIKAGHRAEVSAECYLKQRCELCFLQSGLLWHLGSFHTAQTDRRRAPGLVYGASLGRSLPAAVRLSCESIQVMKQLPTNHHFRILQFPLNFAEAFVARSVVAARRILFDCRVAKCWQRP